MVLICALKEEFHTTYAADTCIGAEHLRRRDTEQEESLDSVSGIRCLQYLVDWEENLKSENWYLVLGT